MNNKKLLNSAFVSWSIMEISEGVIRRGRNTLLDLHNSS